MEDKTRTDTRADSTDKPASQERPNTPPPDNPGSPGQPSRLESRAQAREARQANGAQQAGSKDTGTSPREDRDAKPSSESGAETSETSSTAQAADKDERKPEVRETERPGTGEQERRPPADNSGSSGQPSRLESLARAREAQQANASQWSEARNSWDESSGQRDDKPASSAPQSSNGEKPQATADSDVTAPASDEHRTDTTGTRDQSTEPAAEQTDTRIPDTDQAQPKSDAPLPQQDAQPQLPDEDHPAQLTETDDRLGSDPSAAPNEQTDASTSSEEMGQQQETQEPRSDHNNARGSGELETSETEAPDGELAPQEAHTAEVEQSDRFRGSITITVDSDGRPVPPSRDTDTETANRGELRRPEDDRASRDYQESDPERPSRGRDFMRQFVTKSSDTRDAADKFAEPAQSKFEKVEPTGQLCGARPNYDQIRSPDQPIKAGNAMLGGVGMAIVLTEAFRYGARLARSARGNEYAGNR